MTSQTPTDQVAIDPGEKYLRAWAGLQRLVREGQTFSGQERNCVYLNTGAQKATAGSPGVKFADVSSVSGMDFADDARSVGLTDWDGDGREDFWVANRTAPRLRLMRNVCREAGEFVQYRLQGTKCNRNAIGARIEIKAGGRLYVDTIRAGEGYLAQSSLTKTTGLGAVGKIDLLRVRWPGGAWEEFPGAAPGGRYLLVQGTGRVQAAPGPQRDCHLEPVPVVPHPPVETARIVAVDRPVMPRLPVTDWASGKAVDLLAKDKPLLVLLWASWCLPCAEELKELDAVREKLGADIAAVCVDSAATSPSASVDAAKKMLKRIGYQGPVFGATVDLLTRLDVLQQSIINRWIPLPLPTSLLMSPAQELRFLYKGQVTPAQVRHDLLLLDANAETLRREATPFDGRWLGRPIQPDPVRVASRFIENGQDDTAVEYLTDALASSRVLDPSMRRKALVKLGGALFRKNERGKALPLLLEALKIDNQDHQTLNTVGVIFMEAGKLEDAIPWYEQALKIDPLNTMARANLALSLHSLGRIAGAIPHYRENLRLRRDWPLGANNLAWLLATSAEKELRNGREALELAIRASASAGDKDPDFLSTIAAAHAELGDYSQAVKTAEQALQMCQEGDNVIAPGIREALAQYRENRPMRRKPSLPEPQGK